MLRRRGGGSQRDSVTGAQLARSAMDEIGLSLKVRRLAAWLDGRCHRKRGARQALIAKRIERAEQIGCSMLVSETLHMLEHFFRNLQRSGFQEAYEKGVYEWNA
jgi:hypothetical protein